MALQKNISLDGGVVVSNCYVRIHSVEADKQNEDSDWSLTVLVNVYKDASARNAKETGSDVVGSGAIHLPKSVEYKFSYDPDSEKGDFVAVAYGKLKTHEDFSGASDV